MDKNSSFGRWRRTSPDGRSIDDVGASIVEIQRRYEHDVRECCRQFAAWLGLPDGSTNGLRGTLEEYLAGTDGKGIRQAEHVAQGTCVGRNQDACGAAE